MRESDLAAPVADWLEAQGYVVYSEIFDIDMVGMNDKDELIVVELKLYATTDKSRKRNKRQATSVLLQAQRSIIYTSQVYAAVATKPRKKSIDRFKDCGVGLLSVRDNKVNIILEPELRIDPMQKLKQQMVESLHKFTPCRVAGIPTLKGSGIAQAVLEDIREYLIKHPKADWKEIYYNIENHYSNHNSLRNSMKQWQGFTLARKDAE